MSDPMSANDLNEWDKEKLVFGPVPSRRLGRSLGVNNIPPKICSYSCIYCQLGRADHMSVDRKRFFDPDLIFDAVSDKVKYSVGKGERIDFIAFVPDGEPTLDMNLGRSLEKVSGLGIRTAVITNSSLISMPEVREDLSNADLVSIKIDTVDDPVWRRINRPHGNLKLGEILDGIISFADNYSGTIETETMMIRGINDTKEIIENTASFLNRISPSTANISIPTRPPAEDWVKPAATESVNLGYHIFNKHVKNVRLLTGYEGDNFSSYGDVEKDLLGITSVHPMREDAVIRFLEKKGEGWLLLKKLIENRAITRIEYDDNVFYLRNLEMTP